MRGYFNLVSIFVAMSRDVNRHGCDERAATVAYVRNPGDQTFPIWGTTGR